MNDPVIFPSRMNWYEPVFVYLFEIYALAKISYKLFASQALDDIHKEYKFILKEKDFHRQIICDFMNDDNLLGCIDPIYRHGKPLKYLMDSRHMILAMCDPESLSNIGFKHLPSLHDVKANSSSTGFNFKVETIEMIPISATQRESVHYTYRPFIEFNQVDTFSSLFHFHQEMLPVKDENVQQETSTLNRAQNDDFQTWKDCFNFEDWMNVMQKQ